MTGLLAVLCGVVGLAVGSFLNVVVYRIPRKQSVVRPRSACPSCSTTIAGRDNIPVVSWALLGGRCRHCRARISVRYPLVELATAGLFVGAAARFGADWALPAFCVFLAALLALALTDLEHFLLPIRIVYPALLLGSLLLVVAAAGEGRWDRLVGAGLGAVACYGVFFLINLVNSRWLAFGDVRLAGLIGLFLGWLGAGHVLLGMFLANLLGAAVGLTLMAAGRMRRGSHLPFGVFLALGAGIAVYAGHPLLDAYLGR